MLVLLKNCKREFATVKVRRFVVKRARNASLQIQIYEISKAARAIQQTALVFLMLGVVALPEEKKGLSEVRRLVLESFPSTPSSAGR